MTGFFQKKSFLQDLTILTFSYKTPTRLIFLLQDSYKIDFFLQNLAIFFEKIAQIRS